MEGGLKNYAIDKEFDRQYGEQPQPTLKAPTKHSANYHVTINGNPWKKNGEIVPFSSEQNALRAANSIYAKNPRLRVDVVPNK